MNRNTIEASAVIDAPAERVYGIVADYRVGHPRILPPPFGRMEVERGGYGAGTLIRCEMKVMGRMQSFRAEISEPEPGRVLAERNLDGSFVTTFIAEPLDGGRTRATIRTEMLRPRRGVLGAAERFFTRRFLLPIYRKELRLLEQVAREPA
jgi:hypothetical protein